MKGIKITVMLLIFCQAVVAQTKTAEEITTKHVNRLDSKVTLTETQKEQVTEVVLASTQQIIELRSEDKLTPELRKELKKAERTKVKEILTDEQKAALKEARKSHKEQKGDKANHETNKAKRKAIKTALKSKRADFDVVLTSEEKATIAKARTMVPAKVKGKEAKEALTEEEKSTRKAQMKEIRKMLRPIAKAHQAELKEIQESLPAKPKKDGEAQTENKSDKKREKGFAIKFLLMS